MSAMVDPVLEQEVFRFGSDGTETGYSFIANQSIDIIVGDDGSEDIGFGTIIILRIRFAETAGATSTVQNIDLELQRSLNGGTFAQVNGSSTVAQSIASAMTDGEDATERLTGGATTFKTNNDCVDEADGICGGGVLDVAGSEFTEAVYAIQIISGDVSNTDTVDFRLTRDGGTVMDNEGTADEPRCTIATVAVTAGTGTAPGTATVVGTGRSTAAASGTAPGTATVVGTGVAIQTLEGVGTAPGVATVVGTGSAVVAGSGTAAGVATVVAAGEIIGTGTGTKSMPLPSLDQKPADFQHAMWAWSQKRARLALKEE